MIVTLAVPTLKRYDLLTQLLITSAEKGTRPPDRYYIVDNGGTFNPAGYGIPQEKVTVHRPGSNIGVAAAWNHVHRTVDEYVIMSCDDMDLWPATVEKLVEAADTHPDIDFFFPEHNAHTMFGVYLQRKRLFSKIGEYDEKFWPAYFEDNDYAQRMRFGNIQTMKVAGCGMGHVVSATMKSYSDTELAMHHVRFRACREYYLKKWGGLPGHEKFTRPFNGQPPPPWQRPP